MTDIVSNPRRYNGWQNSYVDVAVRGDQTLGFGIEYAVHPLEKIGCFILRFVATGKVQPSDFTHFTYRETAKFLAPSQDGKMAESFYGCRLNKMVVKVFSVGVHKSELDAFATKLNVWFFVEKWVREQIEAEGFTVNVDLLKTIRGQFYPDATPEESVELLLNFPNLAEDKAKAKTKKKPVMELVKNDDDDPDDEDEDEEEEKDWLN